MNVFIWRKNNVSFSRYQDFVLLWNLHISKSVMSYNASQTHAYFFWILSPIKMKFGQILVCWIQQDLAIFNGWHIPFLIVLYSPFKKMKHWNLDIFGCWVIGGGCSIKKDLESSPSPLNCSEGYWKLLPLLISINWPSLVTSWVVVQKIYLKVHLVSCTNTHCDVTDLINHGMVKNTKTWISWERNKIFPQNKKILNLCFRWHILISYHFVAEVTSKEPSKC